MRDIPIVKHGKEVCQTILEKNEARITQLFQPLKRRCTSGHFHGSIVITLKTDISKFNFNDIQKVEVNSSFLWLVPKEDSQGSQPNYSSQKRSHVG